MRAPSSCSAPPDLLLTGDREPIIGSRIAPTTNNNQQKDSSKVTTQPKTVDGIGNERMLLEVSCDNSEQKKNSNFGTDHYNNNKSVIFYLMA